MKQKLLKTTGLALVSTMILTGAASAQLIDEIRVTAQKREQNLQDVGISVTALSGEQLEQLGFVNSVDIIAQSPGVEVRNVWGEFSPGSSISIRGVSQTDFNDGHESPAVVYIDEFYILPTAASNFSIYDLERVETLRGPQGTLFGRNATAGLIHYLTAKPTDEFEAFGRFTVEEYDTYRFEGAVSGPITDTFSARFSANYNHTDGHVDNIVRNDDIFRGENYSLRGQLRFEPSDQSELLFKAEFTDVDANYEWQPTNAVFLDTDGFIKEVPAGVDFYGTCVQCDAFGNTEDGDKDVNSAGLPTMIDTQSQIYTLRYEHDFDSVKLTSVTGYQDLDKEISENSGGTLLDIVRASFFFDTQVFTQELRLEGDSDNFRWTVGGLYLHQDSEAEDDAVLDGEGLDLFDLTSAGLPVAPIIFDVDWEQEAESWAIFGQAEFDVSDTVTLIGGLRYTYDEKKFELVKKDYLAFPPWVRMARTVALPT